MPMAVPLVAAAAGAAIAASPAVVAFLGATWIAAAAGALVATSINLIGSRMLATKPKNRGGDSGTSATAARERAFSVRSSVESHKIVYGRAKVSGPLVFVKTTDSGTDNVGNPVSGKNIFLHMVVALAGHEVEAVERVYLDDLGVTIGVDGYVTDPQYQNTSNVSHVRVRTHLGAADQAADADLIAECGLTAAHRLRGVAYVYARFQWDQDTFPQGIPNISAVLQGKKLYDPRTGLTTYGTNTALAVRDYLTGDYGFACDADEINDDYFTAAANACDEDVTLSGGELQDRYTCNGVVDTAVAPLDNLAALVSAMAGAVTYVQGKFRAHAGVYDAPAGAITLDMLAGPVRAELRTPRKELFNAVKGTFVDPDRDWQPTDFPFITNATYEAQDGGERIYRDVDLPFTTHSQACQRIAKVLLEKARQGIKVELAVNHSALKYAVYDTVTFTDPQFGWADKVFRILKVSTTGTGPIALVMQEESSESYDWNSGEATVIDPAPDTNLPNPLLVQPPGSPVVTESLYAPLDGSAARSKATVTWPPSPDAFVREYQLERKLAADASYTVVGRTVATTMEVFDLEQGTHTFRVKALNTLGVSSAYASNTTEILGLTAPPAALENFSLNAISSNAHLSWDQSQDLDVRIGGKVRVRWTPDLVSPNWSAAVDIGPALPGVATQAVVPLLNGTYMAKAVDSSGNESTTAATIKSTVADVVKMNRVATTTEHPSFPGTPYLMTVVDGALQLESLETFDSGTGNFDDAEGFFDFGQEGFFRIGQYFFDGPDLGKVTTSRVTAHIAAEVYDAANTFDQGDGDFDDHPGRFDGEDVTGVDVILTVSTTDDNVSWTPYRRFFVGDYTCRSYRFQVEIINQFAPLSLNVRISELEVTVDMPDVTDSNTLTTSASGVTTVTFARDFVIEPDIGVTIQGASVGDQEIVQNVTEDDFEIGVKDSGGSFVARDVSWSANGY